MYDLDMYELCFSPSGCESPFDRFLPDFVLSPAVCLRTFQTKASSWLVSLNAEILSHVIGTTDLDGTSRRKTLS